MMSNSFSGKSITCFRGERFVFEGLDFSLGSGGALVLTGPNGSGKSSLLRIMAGLLEPADGEMERDGEPLAGAIEDHCARLHYVGYQDAIKPVMTVRENLAFWAGLRSAESGRGVVEKALDALGIAALADTPGQFLSSGQRRRLSLARLAASAAPLWLLDEPTVGLDRAAVAIIEGLVAEHRAGGGMAVLATHLDIGLGGGAQTLDLADFAARRQIFDTEAAG
jgi:heme exporter protein A